MEPFIPGAEYGGAYDIMIWVCVNPVTRSFEKCDIAEGQAVFNRLKQLTQGLNQRVMVCASGCMLGCKPEGTTVAITFRQKQGIICLNNVTIGDLPELVQEYLV
jgi:hypothetical protein